jgi:hypothetical protein
MPGDPAMALVLAAVVVWGTAAIWTFRRARARAARRLPPVLLAELRAHKIGCLRQAPERVDLELVLLAGDAPSARPMRMLVETLRALVVGSARVIPGPGRGARRS